MEILTAVGVFLAATVESRAVSMQLLGAVGMVLIVGIATFYILSIRRTGRRKSGRI